jgi:hypothetical protein
MMKFNVTLKTPAKTVFALVLLLAIGLAACDSGSGGAAYDPLVYESASGDTDYTLEITMNPDKAAFTPEAGDLYKMTVTKSGETPQPKTSSGTIASIEGGVFTLRHSGGGTFSVTVDAKGWMSKIEGAIPLDNGAGTVANPGSMTANVDLAGTIWVGRFTYQDPDHLPGREGEYTREETNTLSFFSGGVFTMKYTETATPLGGGQTITLNEDEGSGAYTVNGNRVTLRIPGTSDWMPMQVVNNTLTVPGWAQAQYGEEAFVFVKQ